MLVVHRVRHQFGKGGWVSARTESLDDGAGSEGAHLDACHECFVGADALKVCWSAL